VKIGIIGGGAAGLTSAWLLDAEHEVTLFEQDDRLGGHAHTVEIEAHGQRLAIDAGFQFFGAGAAYASFNRLLDALDVERVSYPATLTVFQPGDRHPVVLPPVRSGWPLWSALTPSAVGTMLQFRSFLTTLPLFLAQHDRTVTIGEYLDQQRLPASFVDGFLYPLLLSFWCVELDEFRGFAAYNALFYLGANLPTGLTPPPQSQVPGGLRVYIAALAAGLDRTRVVVGADLRPIERLGDAYVVVEADGSRHTFDRLVIATNAEQAAGLIGSIPQLGTRVAQLRRIRYFDTSIAIHGDRSLMPRGEREWSVVNARWDGAHSALSIWDPSHGLPVFKSWVSFDQRLPEPLYALASYRHGSIDLDYFDAQQRLTHLQGEHGLWLAGLYTDDADSHESAIRSAISVGRGLAPGSARLRLLTATS
jgi:predicted NAD/FAD-binding protein